MDMNAQIGFYHGMMVYPYFYWMFCCSGLTFLVHATYS
jgi:hypothetical protein